MSAKPGVAHAARDGFLWSPSRVESSNPGTTERGFSPSLPRLGGGEGGRGSSVPHPPIVVTSNQQQT